MVVAPCYYRRAVDIEKEIFAGAIHPGRRVFYVTIVR